MESKIITESNPKIDRKTLSNYQNIEEKIIKSIFLIENKMKKRFPGISCKLPFAFIDKTYFILIINNIYLDKEDISFGNEIKILLKDNLNFILLKIDNSRIIYRENKKDGITIIEIKESDGLDVDSFLEIDSKIIHSESKNIYINNNAFLINIQYGKKPELFQIIIKNIKSEKYEIQNFNSKEVIPIGSPIITSYNAKLIGIYNNYDNKLNYIIGACIKEPIYEFIIKGIKEMKENENENENEITIIYKSLRKGKIKLFGKEFVENNINKCKMIIRDKIEEICENIELKTYEMQKEYFKIRLVGINKLENLEFMFIGCKELFALPNLHKWNVNNVTSMRSMFNGCTSLTIISDISNWNTINVTDMRYMFSLCSSLKEIPDISKWKTDNVANMDGLFNECMLIKKLPDISKWNTSNVLDMSYMFCFCHLLEELPDISEWKTNNVTNMTRMFSQCKNLKYLPDISNWDISSVKIMTNIFESCVSLEKLPDISKWNIDKLNTLIQIFNGCSSLKELPDISKWKIDKINNLSGLFYGCSSLNKLPDISKWQTENVFNISNLFDGCSSLISIPDISRWNTKNVITMSYLFNKCYSLASIPNINNWNISKVKKKEGMFLSCISLRNIPFIFK